MKTKKLTTIILAAGFSALALSACGEWKQNPMDGLGAKVQQGQAKPSVPDAQKPTDSDSVLIDAPLFYSFKETQSGEFQVVTRILEDKYTYTTEITNLREFPGAKFDQATGKFTWTPAAGVITPQDGLEKSMSVKILVIAEKAGEKSLQGSREVKIRVVRDPKAPRVVSLNLDSTTMREGETLIGSVTFEDMDASVSADTWPTPQFAGMMNVGNLSGFITVTDMRAVAANQYKTIFKIDLGSSELTTSSDVYGFSVRPVSRFNQVGPSQNANVTVYTSISEPVTTWAQTLTAKAGDQLNHDFLIMDPKNEAKISFVKFENLPVGAGADCKPVSTSVLGCRLSWNTANAFIGAGSFSASVNLQNTFLNDSASLKTRSVNFSYQLDAAPVTTTTTTTLRPKGMTAIGPQGAQ